MNSFKRSAPEYHFRPNKRHATSSPEEGELDDCSSPPARRSPTPSKSTAAKPIARVPFPFKRKPNAVEPLPEPRNSKSQSNVYVRPPEDERKFRAEEDERRARPPYSPPRTAESWNRSDSWVPRQDRQYQNYLSNPERHYPQRNEADSWEPPVSPRHNYNKRYSSRSPSSPRSRSPASPASLSKEKHRLPPPRSPLDPYSRNYYDDREREPNRKRRDSVRSRDSRDGQRPSRLSWEGDSYVAQDSYVSGDSYVPEDGYSRDRWNRNYDRERRYDDDRDRSYHRPTDGDPYRPISPHSARSPPRSPPSASSYPKRLDGPRSPPFPPQPDAPPPPPPPGDIVRSVLPDTHQAVRISLPKKPPTPVNFSPPTHPVPLRHEERPRLPQPEPQQPNQNGQAKVFVQRSRRKPVQRSREEERKVYGRIFEGCGKQEDYDVITKLGEGTFGYVLSFATPQATIFTTLQRSP